MIFSQKIEKLFYHFVLNFINELLPYCICPDSLTELNRMELIHGKKRRTYEYICIN